MPTREVDLLMGAAFFLVGALLAVLLKAWMLTDDPPQPYGAIYVFGPGASEPERSACEARRLKAIEEDPRSGPDPDDD